MRVFLTTLILCCAVGAQAQTISFPEWQVMSEKDMRLLPRYGDKQKTAEQVASDEEFVRLTMAQGGAPKQASEHLVDMGFDLLRGGNMVQAMYRFNQAFLVRPTNTDIYAGYGAFFMAMDRPIEAHEQYSAGLALDSTNTLLLTGEATVQLHDRYQYQLEESDRQADRCLAIATKLLTRSQELDPKNADTAYKLAVCQEALMNCEKAWKFYDLALELGVKTSDESFPVQLMKTCPR
ncbi:MAG: hypothetical protein ABI432_09155 [Flavobacteriales bacterium]